MLEHPVNPTGDARLRITRVIFGFQFSLICSEVAGVMCLLSSTSLVAHAAGSGKVRLAGFQAQARAGKRQITIVGAFSGFAARDVGRAEPDSVNTLCI